MMNINLVAKITCNKAAQKAITTVATQAGKVVGASVLTNPVTMSAAVVITGMGLAYKHLENKDKRKYQYSK